MDYLLFGGARNTGKTNSVYNLAYYLVNEKSYVVKDGELPTSVKDFSCIIEKEDKVVLIQSDTDLVECIRKLSRWYDSDAAITHIITAIRNEGDPMRTRLFEIMNISSDDYVFEIPLGKVVSGNKREKNIEWYLNDIDAVAKRISEQSPFNF